MKKTIFIFGVISLLFCSNISSAKMLVGVKGGGSFSWVEDRGNENYTNPIIGGLAGGVVELYFNDAIAIELGVMYQQRGGEFSDGIERISYLGFPVFFKFYFFPYLSAGLGLTYQSFISSTHPGYTSGSKYVKDDNLELVLGVGGLFPISPNLNFTVDLRFNSALLNYSANSSDSYFNQSVDLYMGIMLRVF